MNDIGKMEKIREMFIYIRNTTENFNLYDSKDLEIKPSIFNTDSNSDEDN